MNHPAPHSAVASRRRHRRATQVGATLLALTATWSTMTPAGALDISDIGGLALPPVNGSQQVPGYPTPVQHPGAPVPTPFGPDYLVGYVSDLSSHPYGIYLDVVKDYDNLRRNHPEVMADNLHRVIDINNGAASQPALIARAQADARADQDGILLAVSDALGAELGGHFRAALEENRLPKTNFLLGNGYLARAGGLASSTFAEKEYFREQRPFVVAPDAINRYEDGSRNFYSTSKSFPSGHTNQATWVTTLLAVMLPEAAPQFLARGAESGYNRMVMGVHYPLDVMGGRMTGTAAAADRWNDPKMRAALRAAAEELRAELEWRSGRSLADALAAEARPYARTADAVRSYTDSLSQGLHSVGATDAPMIVPQAAPDLLLGAFPHLSYGQRAEVLRQTAIPSGAPLDHQGPAGSWQRLNLAAAMTAQVTVDDQGGVHVRR